MADRPSVSILIPCFNQKDSIDRAIKSALAQSYPNLEIVVADDKSTDGSWEYLQKYQNSNCIRLARNPENFGRVKNHRHLLYDLARGNYALMLDGDDYLIDNEFVAEALKLAQDFSLRLVFAEAEVKNLKGRRRRVGFPFPKDNIIPYQEIFKKGVLFMHGAVLYQRETALKYDFYSQEIIADDNESFLRFILGEKIGFIKRPVYLYQWDSSPDRYPLKERLDNTEMVNSVYQFALEKCLQEKKLFNWWRTHMLATFFYGNLINLGYHQKYNQIREYVAAYFQKYGLVQPLQSLLHPLTTYRWSGYQNLIKQLSFTKLKPMLKFKFDIDSLATLSEIFANLSAAFLAAILVVPNFLGVELTYTIAILTGDIIAATLCLVIAVKLKRFSRKKYESQFVRY